ncbi:MAG: hypothetical protein C0P68_000100 [Bacillota bacterium]
MVETNQRPWMYPHGYEKFASLVREHVVLSILHQAVLYDARRLAEGHKFSRVYRQWLEGVAAKALWERQQVRQEMRRLGGCMLQEKQDEVAREVWARFRGRVYTVRLQNEWLRSCCEERLMQWAVQVLLDMLEERGGERRERSGELDETDASNDAAVGAGARDSGIGGALVVADAAGGNGGRGGGRPDDVLGAVPPRGSDAP